MKYLKKSIIAILGLLLVSCGGDNDGENGGNAPVGETYNQSVTLPTTGAELEVQLTGLTAEINNISGAKEWLTVIKNNAAKASVKLVAKDNEGTSERSCVVTITDKIGDRVLLTVTQTAGKTFNQNVALPARKTEKEVQLTGLTAEINSISGAKEWLTVTKVNGAKASVKLVAKDNGNPEERSCVVTITDMIGDRVLLTVTQAMFDIDDDHDIPTDQPAYIPQKR